ncbi:MAG: restriction endonuclease, SacI family [Acidobacteriaceae bacterium]|nr:restriction endonuclease, SacI family [Acidobacteriaceae bacterium]MBV9763521.1 restriction endonuclease, SacI family [Acidobacteriaceae bacterium]
MPIEYDAALHTLESSFKTVETRLLAGEPPSIEQPLEGLFDKIFETIVQAYRETLLGCALARFLDRSINIRLPYVNQGPNAFNGRTLDERVINPFLHRHRIPASRGPYLAVFRRSVRFDSSIREGQRDKKAYDAFLALIGTLETTHENANIERFLDFLLYKFAQLRESAEVRLARLQRISMEQYDPLISALLTTPSGGRLPVILVLATLRAIKDFFDQDWEIDHQGINVADLASGVGGDITVRRGNDTLFAAEITERPVDRARVVATFNTKIAPNGIEDYLFFVHLNLLAEDARLQAERYFAQGHDLNFVEIKDWIIMVLITIGKRGRTLFNQHLLTLLDERTVPRSIKVAWNEHVAALTRTE